ncbi:hypothetical protein GB937_010753 [Aspergillus fischeri]|nr:hypothetical protein GB937_010753 [Aspergillus fischeri]
MKAFLNWAVWEGNMPMCLLPSRCRYGTGWIIRRLLDHGYHVNTEGRVPIHIVAGGPVARPAGSCYQRAELRGGGKNRLFSVDFGQLVCLTQSESRHVSSPD